MEDINIMDAAKCENPVLAGGDSVPGVVLSDKIELTLSYSKRVTETYTLTREQYEKLKQTVKEGTGFDGPLDDGELASELATSAVFTYLNACQVEETCSHDYMADEPDYEVTFYAIPAK